MKIHFSNVNFSSRSGPNTFAHRLASQFEKMGHNIVSEKEYYDTFLAFIEPASAPRRGSRFIQRLDGIWFKPDQFESHNINIKWAYENCDSVIWQSNFDKKMTQKWWGEKPGEVIYNGIEIENISAQKDILDIKNRYKNIFVCSSNWHRQKRLKENILFFKKVSSKDDCLIVMGNNPDYIVNERNIYYLGNVDHEICLQIFSISDWMIHLAWLDHCPNVVVEALSQYCPVICTDSGGTREIVRDNGLIIRESIEYNFDLLDYDLPYSLDFKEDISLPEIKVENEYLDIKRVARDYERICFSTK